MRYISYRSRLKLRKILLILAVTLGVLIAVTAGLFIYLRRYVVYTSEGARLDFSGEMGGADSVPELYQELSRPVPNATLVKDTGSSEENARTPAKLRGCYVDSVMLSDLDAVRDAILELEEPAAVLLDVRSIYGNYYYTSRLTGAESSSQVDTTAMEHLIRELASDPDLYLIARLPAFRNSAFALTHQECGLAVSGGALWMDRDGCYWLDPANEQVISHLKAVVRELAGLGFREVVFDDFQFPFYAPLVYSGDGAAAVKKAAELLQTEFADTDIWVSLETSDPELAAHAVRVYQEGSNGSEAAALIGTLSGVYDTAGERIVFLTDSRDTRFDVCGVLRPAVEQ